MNDNLGFLVDKMGNIIQVSYSLALFEWPCFDGVEELHYLFYFRALT